MDYYIGKRIGNKGMGYTGIKVHVRVNNSEDIENIDRYLSRFSFGDNYIKQNSYLTINGDIVSFENFEEVVADISSLLNCDVLVVLVYDSDISVLQGYIGGKRKFEEVKSVGENRKMDREGFISRFFPECELSEFNGVLDNEDYLYAEEIFFELSDIVGIQLLER